MAYSDFTLKKVKSDFNLKTIENLSLFSEIENFDMSHFLEKTLKRNVPLALSINTEKARSELIIINILLEVKDKLSEKISLFSGIDFNVDKEQGLNGFCDYIISCSPEQLYLDIPVIVIVEAKNENIISILVLVSVSRKCMRLEFIMKKKIITYPVSTVLLQPVTNGNLSN